MSERKQVKTVPISSIVVGNRHRKDLGDLSELMASLDALGMLQPVGLTPDYTLVFGGRRLEAAKRNGWAEIPFVIVDTVAGALVALKAERDENACRKEMTPSELVSLGRAIEEIEKPKAAQSSAANLKKGSEFPEVETFPPRENKAKTRDVVGSALGVSGRTYEKAKQVVEAAEQDPERFGDLPAKMDETSIHAAHEEMRSRVEEDQPDYDDTDYEFPSESETKEETDAQSPPKKLPKWMVPGGKPVDPDHPFHALLTACTSLSAAITKALGSEHGEKLKAYLTSIQVEKIPTPQLVEHRAIWIEGKTYGARFVGLRGLRKVIKMAGLPGKPKPIDKLREAFTGEDEE